MPTAECAVKRYTTRLAATYINNVDTEKAIQDLNYWRGLQLSSNETRLRNTYLFSLASPRTSWRQNVRAFLAIQALTTTFTQAEARDALITAKCGTYIDKARYMTDFNNKFCHNPRQFEVYPYESFAEARKRIKPFILGLGLAKLAFVFEMAYPDQDEVTCLDTHILKLYGFSGSLSKSNYLQMESHFAQRCRQHGLPCGSVRNLYWNQIHGQEDTRYWSHVLE